MARERCNQCEVVYINGMRCHETGCPNSFKDEKRDCGWCGQEFKPKNSNQKFCDDSCNASYYGLTLLEEA